MNNEFLKNVEKALKSFEERVIAAEEILAVGKNSARWQIIKAEEELEEEWEIFHDLAGILIAEVEGVRREILDGLEKLKIEGGYRE